MAADSKGGDGRDSGKDGSLLRRAFHSYGLLVARRPLTVIFVVLALVAAAASGVRLVKLQSDPQKIWVPPGSLVQRQQDFFNQQFGPFYRIEQLIFTASDGRKGNILNKKTLAAVLRVQQEITNGTSKDGVTLGDVCFRPITGEGCLVESVMGYWQSNLTRLMGDDNLEETMSCIKPSVPSQRACFNEIGVPVMTRAVLGGLGCDAAFHTCGECAPTATAMMVTFLLLDEDSKGVSTSQQAAAWERDVFLAAARRAAQTLPTEDGVHLNVAYMAQRSIQDQLGVENAQNAFVVIVSYSAMFLYISVALGRFPHPIRSRFLLGLSGIAVVIASLASALGLTAYAGVEVSLIISEVVPFLILAIGVDNMFILVKAFDRLPSQPEVLSLEQRIACMLAETGPSITAAAFSETLAFAVGVATRIPALESFCIVAAAAVFIDYLLQLSLFVAALTLDAKRQASSRADCMPCLQPPQPDARSSAFWRDVARGDYVGRAIRRFYLPCLFHPVAQAAVALLFVALLVLSGFAAGKLPLGLQQEVVLPSDSYLQHYFRAQTQYGEAGPPAYIVMRNVDFSSAAMRNASQELRDGLSHDAYIEPPVYSYIAGIQRWQELQPVLTQPQHAGVCPNMSLPLDAGDNWIDTVTTYLAIPIHSDCCQHFGVCGASFSQDVRLGKDADGRRVVVASRMRTQHTPLRTQDDFVQSMLYTQQYTQHYAADLRPRSAKPDDGASFGQLAYPYSLFYVYYEQYSYIQGVALQNVLMALAAVGLAVLALTNVLSSLLVMLCVAAISIDMLGLMWLWNVAAGGYGVAINAVSVVNMVMVLGLSVEFCVHIATSFLEAKGSRVDRAKTALLHMGSSVVTGITLTKFIGVVVLGLAPSALFRIYFFRMYMGVILLGAFHGLVFLPLLLSWIGPPTASSHQRGDSWSSTDDFAVQDGKKESTMPLL